MAYYQKFDKVVENAQALGRDGKGKKWEDYDTIKCLDGTVIDMVALISEQAKAKAALIHLESMFSTFANKLEVVYTFHFDTQATDGVHLFVNPQFTAKLTFEEKVFLMAHECMHCVLDHMRRGKQAGHEPNKSNIAADYEVNQTLVDIGLFKEETIKKLKGLIDRKYSGWSYERIYDDNPQGPSKNNSKFKGGGQGQGNQQQQGGSGQQQQQQQGGGQGQGDQKQQGGGQGQGKGSNQGQGGQQDSGRGEGSQGTVRPEDCTPVDGDPQMEGGYISPGDGNKVAEQEGYSPGPASEEAVSSDWKDTAIKEARKQQQAGRGTVKGLCEKILGIWLTGTDWKKKFRKIVGRALNTQQQRQAYANKNKLAAFNSIARTDKDKFDCVDYVVAFCDVSGSISNEELRYMLSEVYTMVLQLKPETMLVCQFADDIVSKDAFHTLKDFQKYMKFVTKKGTGGTDIKCGFDLLKNDKMFKGTSAELVVIITDGYLTQYKRDPRTMNNLCWAVVDNTSFELQYNDPRTSVVHLTHKDLKK